MNLTSRHRVPELIDQPGLDQRLHRQALDGLRRVNRVSGSAGILWPALRSLAQEVGGREMRALDVGCGGGDVALSLASRARRAGLNVQIDGCDVSPLAVEHARRQVEQARIDASFILLDALADPLPAGYDVLFCSLFLHHLDETEAVEFLRKMAATAGRLVLINDLRRTRTGYLLAWAGCRLLSRSPVVRHDGPSSVAAAFSEDEARGLARRAGLGEVTITCHWPQRYLLEWRRP